MTYSDEWTTDQYDHHINNGNIIPNVWREYCNPRDVNGIRLSVYNASHAYIKNNGTTHRCKKSGCGGTAILSDDYKASAKWQCELCGALRMPPYRYTDSTMRRAIYFDKVRKVRELAPKARSFYHTLAILNKSTALSGEFNERTIVAKTHCFDIDIKHGNIIDKGNRADLQKALNIIREELDTFIPRSYFIQTSGNGIYVMVHHSLCMKNNISRNEDFKWYAGRFDALGKHLMYQLKEAGVTKVMIDSNAINRNMSRYVKATFSIHQTLPLVAIPLPKNVDLTELNPKIFMLKHFDINFWKNKTKLLYHNSRHNEYKPFAIRLRELDVSEKHTDYCDTVTTTNPDGTTNTNVFTEWQRRSDINGVANYKVSTPPISKKEQETSEIANLCWRNL